MLGAKRTIGLRHGPSLLRRRDLNAEVLLFIRDQGDTFGRDPIDECRQDFRCELDSVQRLNQFSLGELTLGTSGRQGRVEVNL